jgi:hypothetical protein
MRSAKGFSLIELMLAVVLTTLFISSITGLALGISRVSSQIEQTGEIVENAQYLIRLMKRELSLVGFYGASNPLAFGLKRPDICAGLSAMPIEQALLYPVDGINNVAEGVRLCEGDMIMSESDVLALRQGLLPSQRDPEQVTDWQQTIYYLSANKSFKRKRIIKGSSKRSVPLAEGVEDFQLEYAIGNPNLQGVQIKFVGLPRDEQEWSQLVAIRFHLLLSSTSASSGGGTGKTYYYAKKSKQLYANKQYDLFTGISQLNNLAPKVVELDSAM